MKLDVTNYWAARIVTGLVRYANERGGFRLYTTTPVGLGLLEGKHPSSFDGMILPTYSEPLRTARVPTVYIGTPRSPRQRTVFSYDSASIAKLAALHLFELGFPHTAYVGANRAWSNERELEFVREHERVKRHCITLRLPAHLEMDLRALTRRLENWLADVPLPCAVFGGDDKLAAMVITAARERGLRVPEDLAVMGVNDDNLWCSSVVPSLTSIAIPIDEMAYVAASRLDEAIRSGTPLAQEITRFSALRVVRRRSTDVVAFRNPTVCDAIGLIRTRGYCEALTVDDVAREVGVSRQYLTRCFALHVGRSVKAELDRVRAEHIKERLSSQTPIRTLMRDMGFRDGAHFCRYCRRLLGSSPRELRASEQSIGGAAARQR